MVFAAPLQADEHHDGLAEPESEAADGSRAQQAMLSSQIE
jgi:hypothetical protein